MGGLLSLPAKSNKSTQTEVNSIAGNNKRRKMAACVDDEKPRLIPNLPDEISVQILARLPRRYYSVIKPVSRSWRAVLTSPEILQVRKELCTTEEWLYVLTKYENEQLIWFALDPLAGMWQRLPLMPIVVEEDDSKKTVSGFSIWNVVGSTIKIADAIRGWLGRKEWFARVPFCGVAVGAVDACLHVFGGFAKNSALQCVWRYDPSLNSWSELNSMTTGRAYCKIGLLNNKLYAVGGFNRGRGGLTPLQSAEVYDSTTDSWSEIPNMPFARAAEILPTALLADMLKPIATGMTSYRGRLCVPQSLYSWPFFVDLGGEVYDPETNQWDEMPTGMGEGWPAKQAGTKLSVVVNGELYALDPSSSLDGGVIKVYDYQEDTWKVVLEEIPVMDFTDSEAPYLLAALRGKLHVITKDVGSESSDIVVFQADMETTVRGMPSTSLATAPASISENVTSSPETENDVWTAIARKSFGSVELVCCQVLTL